MRRRERLSIVENDYGREFGWVVERRGSSLIELAAPIREAQFWHSYRVQPVDGDPLPSATFTHAFWSDPSLRFRNRGTDELVGPCLVAEPPTKTRPRVLVRGLACAVELTLLDRAVLWWRRRERGRL